MHGQPLTRVGSTDGRWAYTLYDGGGKAPFVHALDTANRSARCIDLDDLAGTDLSRLRLSLDPSHAVLNVTRKAQRVVNVDLTTFRVGLASTSTSEFPWLLVSLAVIGALATAVGIPFLARRSRGHLPKAQSEP